MNITYQSIGDFSITTINNKLDLKVGKSIGKLNEGIQPTYGMTADSMGFNSFVMTINIKDKSCLTP